MSCGYRELPHTADVALEIWGRDLPELFVCAAEGLFSLAAVVEPGAPSSTQRQVDISAPDWETLLVDWLNELLLLHEENDEAYVAFEVSLPADGELSARAHATQAFAPVKVIKAATFHDLAIHNDAQGYRAVVVFDV
jgi:SHS2 domain-containing protein